MEVAAYAADRLRELPNLELVTEPDFLNVCLRVTPPGFEQLAPEAQDAFTVALRERLVEEGHWFINYATVEGRKVIRLVFANPGLDESLVGEMLETLVATATELTDARPPAKLNGNGHGCSVR